MKRLLVLLSALLVAVLCHSAPIVAEAPINGYGTPVTISISTGPAGAWTKVPTTQTSGRMGIFIDVPQSNAGRIVGHLGNCTSTSIATTVRPIEFSTTTESGYLSMREDVCLWAITTHTAAENVHIQEIKQ